MQTLYIDREEYDAWMEANSGDVRRTMDFGGDSIMVNVFDPGDERPPVQPEAPDEDPA